MSFLARVSVFAIQKEVMEDAAADVLDSWSFDGVTVIMIMVCIPVENTGQSGTVVWARKYSAS